MAWPALVRIERHERGPRVRILGMRVHHWQAGLALLVLGVLVLTVVLLIPLILGAWLVWDDRGDLPHRARPLPAARELPPFDPEIGVTTSHDVW